MTTAVAPSRAAFASPLSKATNGAAGLVVYVVDAELRLYGDLDLDGGETLRESLSDLPLYGLRTVIVDLARLQFVDAVGVGLLETLARYLGEARVGMLIVRPQPAVRRMLDVARAIAPLGFRVIA